MSTRAAAGEPRSLSFHRRLETHLAVAVTLVVAFALASALLIATRVVNAGSLERASSELDAARSAFYRLEDERAEFAAAQASLVTALPMFRAYMTDSRLVADHYTMQVMADEYRRQLKAAFCIVSGRDASWTGKSGWPEGIQPPDAIRHVIAASTAGRPSRDIAEVGDRLFLVVSEPARFAEETLGALTVGYALDDGVARQLAQITRSDVNIVAGRRLVASSLAEPQRAALAGVIARGLSFSPGGPARLERLGAGEYIAGAFPLTRDDGAKSAGRLVLLQDWAPARRYLAQLRQQLLVAGAAIFGFALAGGLLIARRVSRPLAEMASAAGDIAAGNWTRQVPVRGSAEAIVLARAFNEMTTGLRHWFDEAKKRDDELRQTQKIESIGRLAGGIAHDFNNLLTTIAGYGELALLQLQQPDPPRREIIEILSAAARAAELTTQLLAFSRRQAVAPAALALDELIVSTEQMLRRTLGEDIELVTIIEPGLSHVRADRGQMEHVLLNLVVNARDAMPNGGTLRIKLASVVVGAAPHDVRHVPVPEQYVCLSVSDTGTGMDRETASRIFEPFFTTKAAGRGTGLGLAIVYETVQQAGGMVDVETEIGRGTTFHVYLAHAADGARPDPLAAHPGPAPAVPSRGSETVLLVEDDWPLRTLISTTLQQAGYTVFEVADGRGAIAIARARGARVHLLLTDVVMRGMSGHALSEQIRSVDSGIRVLFMSGYSDDVVLRHGVQTESGPFIRKPFSMEALTAKVRDVLSGPLDAEV